jgi:hypothetical protein
MHPKRRSDLTFSEIEHTGESILVDAGGERAVVLNPLAAVVWLLCDGHRDVGGICDEIVDHFGDAVKRQSVAEDIRSLLTDFEREGLLES